MSATPLLRRAGGPGHSLCQGEQCVPLGSARRGHFLAPPAWRVTRPLRLRFRLPAGERRAVTVGAPRLTVEYR